MLGLCVVTLPGTGAPRKQRVLSLLSGGSAASPRGCSAPASPPSSSSLGRLVADPSPSPLVGLGRPVSIGAPPRPRNSIIYIEPSFFLKKKTHKIGRQTEGAVYRGGGGAGGVSSQENAPVPPSPPERKHQTPVVPGLSTPDRSLLTPDAGHRRLSGLMRCVASPAAVLLPLPLPRVVIW